MFRSIAAVSLATTLAAQVPPTHITPAEAALGLGTVNNSYPFAISPNSYQQVHSASSFSSSMVGVFNKMTFRMARGFANLPGKIIDVEISMANSPNDAINASTTYASNVVPGSEIMVFTRKMISLPQVPDNAWAVVFPFDNAFVFTGLNHVEWTARVYGNSNGNAGFTYQLDAFTGQGTNTVNGTGCQAATGTAVATHTIFAPSLKLGENIQLTGNSFVPAGGLPAFLTFGGSATAWGSVPLPFDLTPLGASGCSIYNDIAAQLGGMTTANANGSVTLLVPLPIDPGLVGGTFYTQYVFLDVGANALGAFTSNGRRNTIGVPYGLSRIYGGLTATGGARDRFFGLAVGFN